MTNTLYSTKAISYQVNDSLLAGNNSIWANRSLTKNLVSQSAKIYANQASLATNGGWDKGKHSKCGEFTPFAKGDLSHLSKEADYPHWQDLRVTNSYAQKKKDSVLAVLIQLHSVEQARNYPDNIELVSRLPNNIGLPDYIGLVQYFLSSVGGWDLNLVNDVHSVDCLALRCLRLISPCKAATMNWAVLSPSSFSNSTLLAISCGTRALIFCDLLLTLSLIITAPYLFTWVPVYTKIVLIKVLKWVPVNVYTGCQLDVVAFNNDKAPQCCSTNRASNHNVKRSNTMAMYKSTQTHPKFKWRFFSCQQSKYFSVEASNEKEARSLLPDSPCLFSARIRQEGDHA